MAVRLLVRLAVCGRRAIDGVVRFVLVQARRAANWQRRRNVTFGGRIVHGVVVVVMGRVAVVRVGLVVIRLINRYRRFAGNLVGKSFDLRLLEICDRFKGPKRLANRSLTVVVTFVPGPGRMPLANGSPPSSFGNCAASTSSTTYSVCSLYGTTCCGCCDDSVLYVDRFSVDVLVVVDGSGDSYETSRCTVS